jgi:hypothetical protein
LSWVFEAPDLWRNLSPDQELQSELNPDQCVISSGFFFVRGVVEIPVLDGNEGFSWCLWVSLSEQNFLRAGEVWDDLKRINEPPYFGWLCNSIPGYSDTLNLKTMVHTRKIGLRPLIELEPTDHALALEQRDGITLARVREIAETMYHHNIDLENAG